MGSKSTYSSVIWFRFIVFSLLGFFLFLFPVYSGGAWTIPLSVINDWLYERYHTFFIYLMNAVLVGVPIVTIFSKIFKPGFILNVPVLRRIFYEPGWVWVCFRIFGGIATIMVLFQVGPECIKSAETGGAALEMTTWNGPLITTATIFMCFLTNFGFMEFVGTLCEKFMRPLFKLPGRAALDCVASWLAAPPVAVMLTTEQYESGYYSNREASIVATCFSLVGISAVLAHIKWLDMQHNFFPIYGIVCLAGVVCALIQVRIWPLNKIKDFYNNDECTAPPYIIPEGMSRFSYAVDNGLKKAKVENKVAPVVKKTWEDMLDVWLSLFSTIMAMATLSMVIAYYTPIFQIISYPFVPLLNLFNVPEAIACAPAFVAGFPDQQMAAILGGATVSSAFTRFVIAVVTLNQLIYMSETGAMIMKSKLDVNFTKLVVLFLQRTIITLPFAIVGAMIFIG